jgi:hypothetical protein
VSAGKTTRILSGSHPAALAGGGEPPYDGTMEERVVKLENDVSATRTDVALIRSNYATKIDVSDLRTEVHVEFGKMRAEMHDEFSKVHDEFGKVRLEFHDEMAKLRVEFHDEMSKLRVEFHDEMVKLRVEFHDEMSKLRVEFHDDIGKLRAEMQKLATDTLKWVVGTVVAMFLGFSGLFLTINNQQKAAVDARAAAPVSAPGAQSALSPAQASHK